MSYRPPRWFPHPNGLHYFPFFCNRIRISLFKTGLTYHRCGSRPPFISGKPPPRPPGWSPRYSLPLLLDWSYGIKRVPSSKGPGSIPPCQKGKTLPLFCWVILRSSSSFPSPRQLFGFISFHVCHYFKLEPWGGRATYGTRTTKDNRQIVRVTEGVP